MLKRIITPVVAVVALVPFIITAQSPLPPLPPTPSPRQISLLFDYPTNALNTNLMLNLYRAPTLMVQQIGTNSYVDATNFTLFTNSVIGPSTQIGGTTNGMNTYKLDLLVIPSQQFYMARASNVLERMEGPFSNVTATDPVPVTGSIRITRP